MTRIFTDGAEAGNVPSYWVAGSVTNVTDGRISGLKYRNTNSNARMSLLADYTEFYLRIAVQVPLNAAHKILQWYNGTTELGSIRLNVGTSCLDAYTGSSTLRCSGTTPIIANEWFVLEVHILFADSGGTLEYKVNNIAQPTFSGDTKPGTETAINGIGSAPNSTTIHWDDIAINSTAGGADNSWCGDAHIYGLTLNGNGDSSQFAGSDGNSTDNYLLVDEIPSNSDTDYVQSATSGQFDLYNLSSIPTLSAGSVINRVVVEVHAKELTADGDSIYLGVKSGTTESWSSGKVLGISYSRLTNEFLLNPDTSSAWTESDINSLQAGIKVP